MSWTHEIRILRSILVIVAASFMSSCETVAFYTQAAAGQMSMVRAREPTARLLVAPETSAALRQRLVEVDAMLQFARQQLSLDPKRRYSSYVHIDSPYVVWNVFATPEFSTRPTRWCYPIAGCAAYRGYFHERDARSLADRLISTRHDATVGGVAAYSTLGWFDDPLLSTFMDWPSPQVAGLIFHELAHGRVYISGDTSFDEALATFVERRGVLEWLRSRGDEAVIARTTARWTATDLFVQYLLDWRVQLQRLYDQPYNAAALRMLKSEMIAELDRCYEANRDQLGGGTSDWFFREPVNNARLVPYAAYHELVAGFAGLFADSGDAWATFFSRAAEFRHLRADARVVELERLARLHDAPPPERMPVRCRSLEHSSAK